MARTPTDTDTPISTTITEAKPAASDALNDAKTAATDVLDKGLTTARDGIATAREQAGPLAEKAKQFAKDRPWAAAALVGSIAAAVLGSLRRGKL